MQCMSFILRVGRAGWFHSLLIGVEVKEGERKRWGGFHDGGGKR